MRRKLAGESDFTPAKVAKMREKPSIGKFLEA
jgi:hypothetical protein